MASSDSRGDRGRGFGPGGASWVEHAPVSEQRVEDAGQAPGEGDGGNVLAAARGDVEGPRAEGLSLRRPPPEDGDRGLNQEPARAGVAGLGDPPAPLALPRAELARHQAEVGFHLVRAPEAADVIDRGDEGGRRDGANRGDGAQALDALIVSGDLLDHLV